MQTELINAQTDIAKHAGPVAGWRPQQVVQATVVQAIREGTWPAGCRLPALGDLGNRFDQSRHAVYNGLRALVAAEVLTVRPRGGFYVAETLPHWVLAETESEPEAESIEPSEDISPAKTAEALPPYGQYLQPRRQVATLDLYVCELYPETLAFWEGVVAGFHERWGNLTRLRLSSCRDGHWDEVVARRPPDVALATPELLRAPGHAARYGMPDDSVAQLPLADMVAPLAALTAAAGPLSPAPFALGLQRLYSVEPHGAATEQVGLDAVLAALRRPRPPKTGLHAATTLPFLLAGGGLSIDATGAYVVHGPRLRELLEELRGSAVRLNALDPEGSFMREGGTGLLQYSFVWPSLRSHYGAGLSARFLPTAAGGSLEGVPLLLAIREDCVEQAAASAFVAHASSLETQLAYGRLGVNLPARTAAALHPETLAAHATTLPEAEAALARGVAPLANGCRHAVIGCWLWTELKLLEGRLSADAAACDLERCIEDFRLHPADKLPPNT